jgi:hypothetical protein
VRVWKLPVLVLAAWLGTSGCSDDGDVGDERADQARTAGLEAGLDDDVADFLALAARGQTATYQATYPGPDEGTELVVANRPPDRRVDIVADDVLVQVQISLDGEAFRCARDPEVDAIEECERTDAIVEPPGAFGAGTIESLTESLAGRVDDFEFTLETSAIAGVEARCLVTRVRAGRERAELADGGTICVSPEGALLRVAQEDELLEATDYTTDIPDNTFVRPDADDDN